MTFICKEEILAKINTFCERNPDLIDTWAKEMIEFIIEEECNEFDERGNKIEK